MSVPLAPRQGRIASGEVWALDVVNPVDARTEPSSTDHLRQVDAMMAGEASLDEKCGVNAREVCCKELKDDDERHLISPAVVRDIVVGLSDGLTVPFALTAGLSSIGSSRLVVTAGLAELCAGAISMGLGGFRESRSMARLTAVASQGELDHFRYLQRQTHARVQRSCGGQMEREVHSILGPFGVKPSISRLVAEQLQSIEGIEGADGSEGVVKSRPGDKEAGSDELGLTAFLLKLGEGMEPVPISRLWISALTIGLSYFIGGLIPLIPYMAHTDTRTGLIVSASVTGVVLFIFGAFKTYFTGAKGGFRGYLWGATSTLLVGGLGAGAAYGLVRAMDVHNA